MASKIISRGKYAFTALVFAATSPAGAQGLANFGAVYGGYLGAQQQYLQNQLMQQQLQMQQQQLQQQRQQIGPQFHTYQFPGGSLNCMTMLQGTPAATTSCR